MNDLQLICLMATIFQAGSAQARREDAVDKAEETLLSAYSRDARHGKHRFSPDKDCVRCEIGKLIQGARGLDSRVAVDEKDSEPS